MKKFIFIVLEGIGIFVFLFTKVSFPCFFKRFLHIPCPGCGMTRALRELIKFHFFKAFSLNIMSIPFAIFLICFNILLFIDIIKKTDYSSSFLRFFDKNYIFVLLIVFGSWITNFIRGI